jgi:hypothetical protein
MDAIWSLLPNDLALHIIGFLDDIDTRISVINQRFKFRNEIVYDQATKTMFDFTGMSELEEPYWIIRRGIPFSQYRSPGLYVFNMEWEDYDMTMFSSQYQFGPSICKNHIVLNKKVKFV